MYYGEIKNCDIANGVGVRVTLFVSGCTNRCKGCFQPQTWDFNFGSPFTDETADELIRELTREGAYPCRTETAELLSLCDILVDGRFEEDKKNISLKFRGSENQRIIDLNETRRQGRLTLWDERGSDN